MAENTETVTISNQSAKLHEKLLGDGEEVLIELK